MHNRYVKQSIRNSTLCEAFFMYLHRTTIAGMLAGLMISGACAASQNSDSESESPPKQGSKFRQDPDQELVEVKIRMPDGRVIVRMEPKSPSRIDPDAPIATGEKPPVLAKNGDNTSSGKVNTTKGDVTGGSNSGSGSITIGGSSGGGGGGGGGGIHSRSGGGGGGSADRGTGNDAGSSDTGSGGISRPSTESPLQPDSDYSVRLYTWDNTGAEFQHAQQAVKVAPWQGRTPARLAAIVANDVRRDRRDKVVLRFFHEFIPADRHPFDISNPRELITSGGFSAGLEEYWNQFALELKANNIRPDYLILDQEEGFSYWHITDPNERRAFFTALLDPTLPRLPQLPDSMYEVTVDQILNPRDADGVRARNDFNKFAAEFRAAFLARIFSGAFEDAYGEYIPISNYRDIIPTFDTYWPQGGTYKPVSVAGISAPELYVQNRDRDEFPRYRNTTKDVRWNEMIEALNIARSTAKSGLVTPWVSAPGYGAYGEMTWATEEDIDQECWLWDAYMSHMLAMGIDTFIVWNPSVEHNAPQYSSTIARQTDVYMDQWLANHPRVTGPQSRDLPPIPLDADQIVTNGYVTTYEQYMQAFSDAD